MIRNRRITRREFLRATALTGAAAAAGTLGTPAGAAAEPVPTTWDYAADVVCVGFGGAGAVAAIAAADLANKVIILEKQAADTAGRINQTSNTRLSGGAILSTSDAADLATYLDAIALGERPKEIGAVWAQYAASNLDWIRRTLGAELAPAPLKGGEWTTTGSSSVEVWTLSHKYAQGGCGADLFKLLSDQVARRGIPVLFETPGTQLVTNAKNEVIGVLGEHQGKTVAIKALKAVILTSGGFEYDEWMKANYLRTYPFPFAGNPANTGDGIRMAQQVGADLWHMNACSGSAAIQFPGMSIALTAALNVDGGSICVDRYQGRRFVNERVNPQGMYLELTRFDTARRRFAHTPFWWVFDETRRTQGPLVDTTSGAAGPMGLVTVSRDSTAEIGKGWILKADSPAELAEKMDLDRAALEQTIAAFNAFSSRSDCLNAEIDTDFARPSESLAPLSRPPYYAVQAHIGGLNTQGGPRKNASSQVLDVRGRPIPRLYAAGECGSFLGSLCPQAGANLADLMVSGRLAAENAATEKPWDAA